MKNYPEPKHIKLAREKAGLTQTEAADLIYASMRSWQNWEGGQRRMPIGLWELFLAKIDPKLRAQIAHARWKQELLFGPKPTEEEPAA